MPKQADGEEWITTKEAATILTKNSKHPVSDAYVRLLGAKGKLEVKVIDSRTKLYRRSDVQKLRVAQKPGPEESA